MNGWRVVACGSLGVASSAPPRFIVRFRSSIPADSCLSKPRSQTPALAQRLAPKAEQHLAVSNPSEPKFPIRKIEILGVTKLTKQDIRKIVDRYENRSLGASNINVLLEALTRVYVNKVVYHHGKMHTPSFTC
jgi:hypothetical protein